jgi:hypothetical protein
MIASVVEVSTLHYYKLEIFEPINSNLYKPGVGKELFFSSHLVKTVNLDSL